MSPTTTFGRFPVVKTWEEAEPLLQQGCGVGIDCNNMTPAESEELQKKISVFFASQMRLMRRVKAKYEK